MNQATLAFGPDAAVLSGYAQTANERLGNIDFLVENTGDIDLYFQLRQHDGTSSPSGYANVGAASTVSARGTRTLSYTLLSKRVGFFGSGVAATVTVPSNATGVGGTSVYRTFTTANVSAVIRNKGDLRGAQIDVTAVGRQSWGYDNAFSRASTAKKWCTVSPTTGAIDPTTEPTQQ